MKILRPEVEACYKSSGGLFDLIDNEVITTFNITIGEMDFISENMSMEEEKIVTTGDYYSTFSGRRKVIEIRNKYLKMYNDELSRNK